MSPPQQGLWRTEQLFSFKKEPKHLQMTLAFKTQKLRVSVQCQLAMAQLPVHFTSCTVVIPGEKPACWRHHSSACTQHWELRWEGTCQACVRMPEQKHGPSCSAQVKSWAPTPEPIFSLTFSMLKILQGQCLFNVVLSEITDTKHTGQLGVWDVFRGKIHVDFISLMLWKECTWSPFFHID